jgi:hypothetical protein
MRKVNHKSNYVVVWISVSILDIEDELTDLINLFFSSSTQ